MKSKAKVKAAAKATRATAAAKPQEMTGAKALSMLKPRLAALAKKDIATVRTDIGAGAIAAQGVSKRTLAAALRGRFEKMATAGEFDLGDLELLSLAGLATQEARQNADKALAKGAGKVPLETVKRAANVEHRMQSACEHTLAGIDAARSELLRLSPGSGYRDLADDLVGYADLYDAYPADVTKDGVNFLATDAADARKLARKIYDALGDELTERDKAQLDTLARAWTFLLQVYERVAEVGRFLERAAEPELSFPSLFAVGRPGGGRPRKTPPAAAPPAPAPSPPDGGAPASAPAAAAPSPAAPIVATSRPARARGRRHRR